MSRVIGYTYEADEHCTDCARRRFSVQHLRHAGRPRVDCDEHGIPYNVTDREGNRLHPIFSTDEGAHASHCGDCGRSLED